MVVVGQITSDAEVLVVEVLLVVTLGSLVDVVGHGTLPGCAAQRSTKCVARWPSASARSTLRRCPTSTLKSRSKHATSPHTRIANSHSPLHAASTSQR